MDDGELLQRLDVTGHLWLIRGGPMGVFGAPCATLREALTRAHALSSQSNSPGPIMQMPNDAVVVSVEQIFRLWRGLGLVS
jgi:hypothetical protein